MGLCFHMPSTILCYLSSLSVEESLSNQHLLTQYLYNQSHHYCQKRKLTNWFWLVCLFLTSLTLSIIGTNIGEDICYHQFRDYFKEQKASYSFLCRAIQTVKSHLRLGCDLYSYTIIREENATWNRWPVQGNFRLGREFYRTPLCIIPCVKILLLLIPNSQEFF